MYQFDNLCKSNSSIESLQVPSKAIITEDVTNGVMYGHPLCAVKVYLLLMDFHLAHIKFVTTQLKTVKGTCFSVHHAKMFAFLPFIPNRLNQLKMRYSPRKPEGAWFRHLNLSPRHHHHHQRQPLARKGLQDRL